jgi:transcriptional regulator with XRE-family HTH domain
MKLLTTLRTSLGISQRQLAAFIGGDRSQLVRAENGERNLSDSASLQFIKLVPVHAKVLQMPLPTAPPDGELLEQLKQRADDCRHKASLLKRKLQQMQQDHETACRLKLFAETLQQQQTEFAHTPKQQRWLEQRIYEADKKVEANSCGKQLLLHLKIQALEAEAGIYENAVEEIVESL